MRRPLVVLALAAGLLDPVAPPAHATGTVTASFVVTYSQQLAGGQLTVVGCRGIGSVPDTVSISVTCTIIDGATRTVSAPGPAAVAVVAAYTPPSPWQCGVASVSATATFADGTSATVSHYPECPNT